MRRYLLDTTPVAALLHARPAAVELMRPWLEAHEATTSIMAYGEVVEYIRPRPNFTAHHQALKRLLHAVYPYFLTYTILERYAQIRLSLRPPQGPGLIGDVDTLIAATALERGLTVVTVDADLTRVPDLNVILLDRHRFTILDRREG